MEGAALVAEAVLAGRELAEVARGLGHNVVVQPEDNAAHGLRVDRDVKLRAQGGGQRARRKACATAALTKTFDLEDVGRVSLDVIARVCARTWGWMQPRLCS